MSRRSSSSVSIMTPPIPIVSQSPSGNFSNPLSAGPIVGSRGSYFELMPPTLDRRPSAMSVNRPMSRDSSTGSSSSLASLNALAVLPVGSSSSRSSSRVPPPHHERSNIGSYQRPPSRSSRMSLMPDHGRLLSPGHAVSGDLQITPTHAPTGTRSAHAAHQRPVRRRGTGTGSVDLGTRGR